MLSINNADWFIYGVICFSNKSELEISYFLGKWILLFPLAEYTPLKAFAYQAQVGMVRLTNSACQSVPQALARFPAPHGGSALTLVLTVCYILFQLPYSGDVACLENSKCSRLGGKSVRNRWLWELHSHTLCSSWEMLQVVTPPPPWEPLGNFSIKLKKELR